MEVLIGLLILVAVAFFVLAPFRSDGSTPVVSTDDPVLAELEARKQAKYREIRDTELDRAQGKLTEPEFVRQEAELRAEAIEILKAIDAHRDEGGEGDAEGSRSPGPAKPAAESPKALK